KTSGYSYVYCLVVWRLARLRRALACDSCVSPANKNVNTDNGNLASINLSVKKAVVSKIGSSYYKFLEGDF
ncbi:hypothetical protein, partial [Nostoc sp.]|uniref:hypothetical protein n=1 Tax=Nostoc sp. TaxID=1180 RepID=UPI002FF7DEBF